MEVEKSNHIFELFFVYEASNCAPLFKMK